MARVFLSLGSNLGNKKENLDKAIDLLKKHDNINVIKISSYYETEPVGYTNQDYFLNIVIEIETALLPYDLFEYCSKIEQMLKRKRIIRWGPRTIDIDILLYDDLISNDEKLTIPHPRMTERAFVLVPLYEIAPDIKISGQHISLILKSLKKEGIRKIEYGR
ncbi:2-amino-4-hydroxy-6-hydroxymethyldihydropteridinediphosphokinase [Caminicella sporogenes DSM 14501]|uniref:2-amino-4-hydroxy-6-hydroxymethyldihydropteridine diphosphokinase n=1 Tax=Caminicella sporogenes DSM 14501 TaxID=1121266 RepID=A0A1M6P214_9FIRM|nr:2-amino-4-hydroxy-6-hydroxymethyldihydropteridine diphosphokinase [Caminicella sporogenes]RKD21560.1 2-amino-4-hydroxy-6-hydroxymethyldihydropteridine diphosphokinase [Caminicella sporogenes]SHK01944.1 2-amino-4-hydroxy-6-hydroxymethyldihydropteridinediphosphokinase [Caminicella sporogenes DSM 14501]